MAAEETQEERDARLAQELQDREDSRDKNRNKNKNKNKNKRKNNNDNSNSSNDEEDDDNDNDNVVKTTGNGTELKDGMDGLEPPLGFNLGDSSKRGINGKRGFEETSDKFDIFTGKFLRKEITRDQYMTIMDALKDNNGNSRSKGGVKSRRGGKHGTIVCYFLFSCFLSFFFVFVFCCCCCVLLFFSFSCVFLF